MEIILLVDDEADALATTREMLTGRGYRVLDALNGEQAARVASAHVGPIHLLLTKAVMPGVSGEGLAQQLRLQRPEMKVLYMAEFTLLRGQQEFSGAASGSGTDGPIILKPFIAERLTEKVQEVLTARPPSPLDPPPDPWKYA
jgi:two-component system, cell cycle sensor histidine kinase and response regulator CckA